MMNNAVSKLLLNGVSIPEKIRGYLAYCTGITDDKKIRLKKHVFFENPAHVRIGKGCLINHYCGFYTGAAYDSKVIIGDHVLVGMGTKFITTSHEIGDENQRGGDGFAKDIVVEDGCWLAADVTVLPGVTIRKGCVIAAGAVVTKSTEPNSLYAGVPARKIRNL